MQNCGLQNEWTYFLAEFEAKPEPSKILSKEFFLRHQHICTKYQFGCKVLKSKILKGEKNLSMNVKNWD